MRTLTAIVLMSALLLTACGVDNTQTDTAPNLPSAAAGVAEAAPSGAPAEADNAGAASIAAAPVASVEAAADTVANSPLGIEAALEVAASAVAAASAANAAAGPSDDGCPSGMTTASPEKSSLAASWNPDGTITVRGGLDVPADATMMMFTYQDGIEVGWAPFGSFGMIEMKAPFEQTSTIPEAGDMIYGEMAKEHPYQPGSKVCVALMAIRGDASVEEMTDPAKQDELLLTRVRLPVDGDAPSEMVLR